MDVQDEPEVWTRPEEPNGKPSNPPATTLSAEDLLRGENLQLKASLLLANRKELNAEYMAAAKRIEDELKAVQDSIAAFKADLAARYNIDFSTQQIDSKTGNIVAVPTKD